MYNTQFPSTDFNYYFTP